MNRNARQLPEDRTRSEPTLTSKDVIDTLETVLGYRFERRDLLLRAVTHRSFSYEKGEVANYERLEFLGDSVLGLLTARWLFDTFPARSEGELSKLKSYLVSEPVLASFGKSVGLGRLLRLGVGEDRSGGRDKSSILADCVESLFGAMYLDGGIDVVAPVVRRILAAAMEVKAQVPHTDAKTHLQEISQAQGWGLPDYVVVAESGPDHQKVFTIQCSIGSSLTVSASGRSKKVAAQRAAANALDLLATAASSDHGETEGLVSPDAT